MFFGGLEGALATDDGNPIAAEEVADIALTIIDIIKSHHIVDVWSNDIAQNKMRNVIDDYFFDLVRDERGIELAVEVDGLELKIMDLARDQFSWMMHIYDAADKVTREFLICTDDQNIIEKLLALNPRPIVVPLTDGDGERRLAASQKSVYTGSAGFMQGLQISLYYS